MQKLAFILKTSFFSTFIFLFFSYTDKGVKVDTYIEITFLTLFLMHILCFKLINILLKVKYSTYYLFIISLFISLLLFLDYKVILLVVDLLVFCYFYGELFIIAFLFYWLLYSSMINFLTILRLGICEDLIFYVASQFSLIIILLIIITVIILLINWEWQMKKVEYTYLIKIRTPYFSVKTYAFYDTGNIVTYHDLPVIFLNQKLVKKEDQEKISEQMRCNFLEGNENLKVIKGILKFKNNNNHLVYVALTSNDFSSLNCDCILNFLIKIGE